MLQMHDSVPRKHRKQMTAAEIAAVESATHSVPSDAWELSRHLRERALDQNILPHYLQDTLAVGEVIEARPDGRIVMRDESGLCVCANLRTRLIITCWYNSPDDHHPTLNLARYTWTGNAATAVAHV